MKPKIIYHGSNKKLKLIEPRKPFDDTIGVYATPNRRLALAMGLTCQKGSSSFLSHDMIKLNFVRGSPKMKYVYLHHVPSVAFAKVKKDEYKSQNKVLPTKIEKINVSRLKHLWRRSNNAELKEFLKDRDRWKTPSA